MAKLTGKQQKFVDEYLKCFNATKAAERAGYKATNGSLRVIGHNNLTNINIQEAIAQYFQASAMSVDECLSRIADIARGQDGDKVKHSDKLRALELIGKAYNAFDLGSEDKPLHLKVSGFENALDKIYGNQD